MKTYKCSMDYEVIVRAKNETEAHEIAEKELSRWYSTHHELLSLLTIREMYDIQGSNENVQSDIQK